jgi:two-component system CheB/CheR fusion protein
MGLLAAGPPHVVLTDLAMPGRDGYDLLATIRADHRWTNVPIVALTAGGRIDDEKRAADAGFQAFLRKPIGGPALAAALAEACRKDQARR